MRSVDQTTKAFSRSYRYRRRRLQNGEMKEETKAVLVRQRRKEMRRSKRTENDAVLANGSAEGQTGRTKEQGGWK